jgi:hypothetical protein
MMYEMCDLKRSVDGILQGRNVIIKKFIHGTEHVSFFLHDTLPDLTPRVGAIRGYVTTSAAIWAHCLNWC